MRRVAKETVVVIYGVLYTEHCGFTLRTETIACPDNVSLDKLKCMCTSGLREFYKEHLAIRRIFSLVDIITNTKFSNCPNIFEIGVV